jgi:Na+/phosphate symporter
MEERELTQGFHELFEEIIPLFEQIRKSFFAEKREALRQGREKFSEILKSRVQLTASILEKRNKDEIEKRFTGLVADFQRVSFAMENLINKMEAKVELRILFSEKALMEIKELFTMIDAQLRDTKDYLLTKNVHLKKDVKEEMHKIITLADDNGVVHQQRLITGICMPQASYLYLDMVDSFKRIAHSLGEFADKI